MVPIYILACIRTYISTYINMYMYLYLDTRHAYILAYNIVCKYVCDYAFIQCHTYVHSIIIRTHDITIYAYTIIQINVLIMNNGFCIDICFMVGKKTT